MPQPTSQSRHTSRWRTVLVGREREQAMLRECLHDALAGHGSLVLVSGEAGIGKTSLIHALANEANAQGAAVLTSACYDLTVTPPYGPWLELLSGLAEDNTRLPLPVGRHDDESQRAVSRDALLAEAFDVLAHAASKKALVAILEDFHWADSASLDFLRYVARQLSDLPLLVVVTYRDTELERQHPLRQLLPLLVRESQATRVSLRPLTETDVRALVEDRYGLSAADTSRLTTYLQRRAEGNPLFIGETLKTLEETGSITLVADGWEIGNLAQIPIPPLIRQVIEGRLARLDDLSRNLLAIASVIGQDIPLNVWRDATGTSEDDLSAVIRSAIDCDLLEEVAGPTPLRFTHALVREALYYELDLPQRRAWHRAVGETLATRPSPEPDTVAYHFREARDDQASVWLMAAGERAQQLYAWRTAAERFRSVVAHLGSESSDIKARGWLHYRIGTLLIYADPNRGISHLAEAERVALDIGDEHLAAYARADRGLLRCLVGDVRRGLAEMSAGVAALDALPVLEFTGQHTSAPSMESQLSIESIQRGALALIGTASVVDIRRGALIFWLAWSGRYSEVIEMGEPYVRQASNAADGMQDSLGDALAGLGHAYAALGRPDEALDAFARARETYQSIDHHFKVGNTAIYELSQAYLPYRADRVIEREWLAEQAEAG
jgi:tetratricopeptide (TPR) repeat protein